MGRARGQGQEPDRRALAPRSRSSRESQAIEGERLESHLDEITPYGTDSEEIQRALDAYCSDAGKLMNHRARGGRFVLELFEDEPERYGLTDADIEEDAFGPKLTDDCVARLEEQARELREGMKRAFKNAPRLARPAVVYRGLRDPDSCGFGAIFKDGSVSVPDEPITDPGFPSTTTRPEKCLDFMPLREGDGVRLQITVPEGTPVLWMPKLAFGHIHANAERELVLPAGGNFKVTGYERKREDGAEFIELETRFIPPGRE